MKKKYIDAELRVVRLTTNVIATSNYGTNAGEDRDENGDLTGANSGDNSFAPSRYGRYSSDYDLY